MAMLFIVFDVELAFLFPWAIVFRGLGLFGFSKCDILCCCRCRLYLCLEDRRVGMGLENRPEEKP